MSVFVVIEQKTYSVYHASYFSGVMTNDVTSKTVKIKNRW